MMTVLTPAMQLHVEHATEACPEKNGSVGHFESHVDWTWSPGHIVQQGWPTDQSRWYFEGYP